MKNPFAPQQLVPFEEKSLPCDVPFRKPAEHGLNFKSFVTFRCSILIFALSNTQDQDASMINQECPKK